MRETIKERSRIMRAVKSKDTAPELTVRREIHRIGYRFRLHRSDLPGKPDVVLPRLRSAVFIHGCFWHGHHCARGARIPKRNQLYWVKKVKNNRIRDKKNLKSLAAGGWKFLVVWECATRDKNKLSALLNNFLSRQDG